MDFVFSKDSGVCFLVKLADMINALIYMQLTNHKA